MVAIWQRQRSEKVFECRVFALHVNHSRSAEGKRANDFYVLESRDWCNIIPITSDDRVVLIRQFRHGIEGVTLEIPGGIVDPTDDSPLEAARREMLEETGYDSREILPLGVVHPNPAILNNRCYSFVARNAWAAAEPTPEGDEETEVLLVPLAEIPARVQNGEISHALVIVAFHWLGFQEPKSLNP
jgi:8-oxo-dGTP pyrophosphatase MutT (NUDIX family)